MKEKIKTSFPYLYELYMSLKEIKKRDRIKKKQKKFYEMSVEEIKRVDAALYEKHIGRPLDWEHLVTYTEKMQWAKIFDKDERKVVLADKYAVREWVKETIGEEYLIPLIGVWERYSDIDFKKMPDQYVLKTNHGSADVAIVKDKNSLSKAEKHKIRRMIETSLIQDYSCVFCELHYSKIPAKIIAEKFIDSGNEELRDYKFLCFDGEPLYCWVDFGRHSDHKRDTYDMNWVKQDWNQNSFTSYGDVEKPKNFEKMVEIARKLSAGFSHVRVDLYNVDGKIYFGEMTFTNGSGFKKFNPPSVDYMIGELWHLDMKM